jgi:cobalt-zinc-cadmium resistance protein CzcA
MALTLTFALVAGTLFAMFAVPALASFALKRGVKEERSWIVRKLVGLYLPALDFAQRSRRLVYAVAFALIAAGGITFWFIGSEFLPKLDEGALWVRIFMPRSIAPTEAAKITADARHRLASFPEATNVLSQLGRPDDGTDINGFDVAEFNVNLRPRSAWTTAHDREGLVAAMGRNLAEIPGVDSQFSQYIEDNVNEAVSGIKSELAIKLYGEDPTTLQRLADQIAGIIAKVPGADDVSTDQLLGQPQIQITIDRASIARYGLSVSDVQSIVETAMGGAVASQVLEGERTFDLVVKLSPRAVSDVESIRNIPVFGANGERLTLGALSAVDVRTGLGLLMREDNERRIAIKLSVRGRSLGDVVTEAEHRVNSAVSLPKGYRLEWTGSFENEQRAVRRLAVIVPLTLLLIFFLLFTAFDSGKLAALILVNVLYAAAGGILALPLSGLNLSVAALVGFVALFGISIQNRVILVARIRELQSLGHNLADSIREGAVSRIRPMVMTALMAMLGLLPAALSHGVGAETARPFAVVIIGGLIADTLLTVFLVPLLYPYFDKEATNRHLASADAKRSTGNTLP